MCVKEMSRGDVLFMHEDVSFMHTNHMFDRKKSCQLIIFECYIYFYQSPLILTTFLMLHFLNDVVNDIESTRNSIMTS